ncbi:MAG: hypothetical protein AAFV53_27495 [Myxococcota bacterium]
MPLDDADKQFITDLITTSLKTNNDELDKKFATAESVTKIVEQGLEKLDVTTQIKTALDDGLKEVREKLNDKGNGEGGKTGKEGEGEPSAEVLRLQERQQELERKLREQEQEAAASAQRERDSRLDGALRSALSKHNIPADRHDLVIPVLRNMKTADGKPVLYFDDAGKPLWTAQRKGYTDKLNVEDGIAEWAKTDVAKVYIPASGKQGAGGGGGESPGDGGGGVTSMDALANDLLSGLF